MYVSCGRDEREIGYECGVKLYIIFIMPLTLLKSFSPFLFVEQV